MFLQGCQAILRLNSRKGKIEGVDAIVFLRIKTKYVQKGFEHTEAGKKGWKGYKYLLTKDGEFLVGHWETFYNFLREEGCEVILDPELTRVSCVEEPFDAFEYPMRGYQIIGVKLLLDKPVMQSGIIKAATNAGKSYMICSLALTVQEPVLILIHTQLIYEQLLETLRLYSIEVGCIDSNNFKLGRIVVAMQQTLTNRTVIEEVRSYLSMVKVVMVDECHRAGAKDYQAIFDLLTNVAVKGGFSGTPLDGKQEEVLNIKGTFGEILLDITNNELISQKVSSQVTVKIHSIPYIYSKVSGAKAKELMFSSKARLNVLYNVLKNDVREKLIVVEELKHAEIIKAAFPSFNLPIIHGKLKLKEKQTLLDAFYAGQFEGLITTSATQEGVDMKNVRTIVYMRGYSSITKLKQFIGRGLRKKDENDVLEIHDFVDLIEPLLQHSENRVETYKIEQFKIDYE